MSLQQQLSIEEAKAIMRGGLGKYELELVTSFCTPLYWAIPISDRTSHPRNGTAFFLNAGQGPFGVTACHVIDRWRVSKAESDAGPLRLGGQGSSIALDWDARVIDANVQIDIATFSITDAEVKKLGKTVLTGYQETWPPRPPGVNCGVYYCGYPGVETRQFSMSEVEFGALPRSGIATSVSEKDISTLIDRGYLMPALGGGIPPENFDFGGISGGPLIMVVQSNLRSWALAGVIYQGPNTSDDPDQAIAGLEIIKARRAHFILSDGRLDTALWRTLNP